MNGMVEGHPPKDGVFELEAEKNLQNTFSNCNWAGGGLSQVDQRLGQPPTRSIKYLNAS